MKYILNKGLIVQKMKKQTVIFSEERSTLITLNETGAFIFSKAKNGLDSEKIGTLLAKKYKISQKEATSDTNEFINLLSKKKILLTGNF